MPAVFSPLHKPVASPASIRTCRSPNTKDHHCQCRGMVSLDLPGISLPLSALWRRMTAVRDQLTRFRLLFAAGILIVTACSGDGVVEPCPEQSLVRASVADAALPASEFDALFEAAGR